MSKNQNFEEAWKNAFENAEVTPSPKVWKEIENQLPSQSLLGKVISLGTQYYVAAAVAASVSVVSLGTYFALKTDNTTQILPNAVVNSTIDQKNILPSDNQNNNENTSTILAEEKSSKNSSSSLVQSDKENFSNSTENKEIDAKKTISDNIQSNLIAKNTKKNTAFDDKNTSSKNLPPKNGLLKENLASNDDTKILDDKEDNLLEEETALIKSDLFEKASRKSLIDKIINNQVFITSTPTHVFPNIKNANKGWKLFGGVAFGGVTFEPNFKDRRNYNDVLSNLMRQPGDSAIGVNNTFNQGENVVSFLRSVKNSQDFLPQINSSYSYGINLGTYLSDKLNVQLGIHRQHFSVSSYSYAVIWDLQNIEIIHLDFTNYDNLEKHQFKMESVKPYKIIYEYDFVAVPVLVGYEIMDRKKISVEANLGLSTQIFLKNKIYSKEIPANVIRHDRYDDRKVFENQHIQAVIGCNISYDLWKNCAINISPSYQKAITDFTVKSSNFSSRPAQMGVSFGVRYDLD